MVDPRDEERVLREIVAGTATETGERFFQSLVEHLAGALGTAGAWVTEFLPETRRLRAHAFWIKGRFIPWEAPIDGSPCEVVVTERRLVHIPDRVLDLYPGDPDLRGSGAVSYLGVPLEDVDGTILGHLAVLDSRPMPQDPRALALFRIFAQRAAAELRRLRAEREVAQREEKLRLLVQSAMDAIIELDAELRVERLNDSAGRLFACRPDQAVGRPFVELLMPASATKVRALVEELDARPASERSMWIPGTLEARREGGSVFRAEATLSGFEVRRERHYTLILRNVEERLEAERRIRSLTVEAEYLRQELAEQKGQILGESPVVARVHEEVRQVAPTDATVLILGETGTGKELVARAIHAASPRRDRPLIKVNCAAIPATLIESELFGHEKGAFTGALTRREGRFGLADGGTIFLDELGELPFELQPKLLRVLQEGELEPVGSEKTRKVDVRVLAATNRDLLAMAREGKFREDLYYRINVFPLRVPPLRERGDDVALLARAFAQRCAQRLGKPLAPLDPACLERLRRYEWPGNVRELENVIERAVITARDGRLDLERALPEPGRAAPAQDEAGPARIRTRQELEALERENLIRALESTGWKVSGPDGAAKLLDMNPSTLSSRLKALKIQRPASRRPG